MLGSSSSVKPLFQSENNDNHYHNDSMLIEISPAIAINDNELACYHLVQHSLETHKSLSSDDIQYAVNYICSFFSYSHDILKQNPIISHQIPFVKNTIPNNLLTLDQLLMFLVYADQTGTSRFALIFNEDLVSIIKNRNNNLLRQILLGPKEMFIEIYDNPFLSVENTDFLIRLVSREIFAMKLAFEFLKKKLINLDHIDNKCNTASLLLESIKDESTTHIVSLTSKCYDEVCIQDAKILDDTISRANMSKHEKTPKTVFTIDKPSSSNTPHIYCFNTIELISAVTNDPPINPKTNEPFTSFALDLINQRFHKEISMYQRYKQIKQIKQIKFS